MNQKLAEARILAARKMPYMTHQVMALIPVERPGLGTMAVDQFGRLYFDPAFLAERDLKHLAFVVLHEAIHVWSRHAKRSLRLLGEKPANDRLGLWRQAVDAAVNDVLEQSGLRCPDEGITPAKLGLPRNRTAEEYFDLLLQKAAEQEEQERAAQQAAEEQARQEEPADQSDDGEQEQSEPNSDETGDDTPGEGEQGGGDNGEETEDSQTDLPGGETADDNSQARRVTTTANRVRIHKRATRTAITLPAKGRANPAIVTAMVRQVQPKSVGAARMASSGLGRMAHRRQNIPAWPSMTRTSWNPPSPRPSKPTKSNGAAAVCPADYPDLLPNCSTLKLTRPENCWLR